jgi:hypothetical protein
MRVSQKTGLINVGATLGGRFNPVKQLILFFCVYFFSRPVPY